MLSVAFYEFLSNLTILVMFIKLVGSSLFCIGANKGLNDYFMKKEFILIFFLLEHCSSLVTGLLTYMLWITKTMFMVHFFVLVTHS